MTKLTKEQKWEKDKIERRRLRGRQKSLRNNYFKTINTKGIETASSLKDKFIDNLKQESKLDSTVDPDYYPIFFDNVFRALGFKIYAGKMPTVSGIQPDSSFHLAIDNKRLINIKAYTESNFAQIADIQPLSSKPIIGVGFNTLCNVYGVKGHEWFKKWEEKNIAVSISLGIGRLNLDNSKIILDGIRLDPNSNKKKLLQISEVIGLSNFLNLSIDNIPVYGAFKTVETRKIFQELNVKKMFSNLSERGFDFSDGNLSNIPFKKGLKNPTLLIKELKRNDYLEGETRLVSSPLGDIYTSQNILRKTQEGPLLKATNYSFLTKERKDFSKLLERVSRIDKNTTETNERSKLIEKNILETNKLLKKLLNYSESNPDKIAKVFQKLIDTNKLIDDEKTVFGKWLDMYLKLTDTFEKTKFWMDILPQIVKFGTRASILITLILSYLH
ncbi:MAG: hypothetical protein KAT28_02920 [Candidatus Aenigmarchaeota archaeon]|nr:hypothetical protein [Candidatus Aenigmarchaeota archaeon]